MPNIEIHGFSYSSRGLTQALALRSKVEKVMQEIGLGEDAITNVVPSLAVSCDGKRESLPFLRIVSDKRKNFKKIRLALRKAGIYIDVESLRLESFIPAPKSKKIKK